MNPVANDAGEPALLVEMERLAESAARTAVEERLQVLIEVVTQAHEDLTAMRFTSVVPLEDIQRVEAMISRHEELTTYLLNNYRLLLSRDTEETELYRSTLDIHACLTHEIMEAVSEIASSERVQSRYPTPPVDSFGTFHI